jgi:large subunit ribosomal protein L46
MGSRVAPRLYSTAAPSADATSTDAAPPAKAPAVPPKDVFAGLILSRIPIVTPELSDFEKAYYHYQDELERRLMWTFPQYFYFKKGTLSERKFTAAQKGPVTRQPGVWYPRGVPDIKFNRERRFKQEIVIPRENSEDGDSLSDPIVPNPRVTEADAKNDTRALTRKLDRTLYLLVQQNSEWKFPSFSLEAKEPLHDAAERGLRQIGGVNMKTWTVSNTPAAVLKGSDAKKEFFIKSHIIHGTFNLQNTQGVTDYAWLTKNEVSEKVDKKYYEELEALLANN